jgi:phosphoglucosamine mutase
MTRLFGTDGIRGVVNTDPMTVETVLRIGKAIAYIFKNRSEKGRIVIGKDTRLSGYIYESALSAGICSMGADVLLTGPLPTSGIAFVTADLRADAGVVISASHNPYHDNGIKFFAPDGYKISDKIENEIEDLVLTQKIDRINSTSVNTGKAYRVADGIGRYIVFLKSVIPSDMKFDGLKVVLDCANGAAYKIGPALLEELSARVYPINIRPSGKNINSNCGALYPEEMASQVKRHNADIGLSLDGDGDRLIIADEKGKIHDGDQIIYMLAKFYKKHNLLKNNTVVLTHMSNLGIELALNSHAIKCIRTKVGDRFVVEEMKRAKANIGGEQSGHIVFLDDHTTGDGLITALKLLWMLKVENKPVSEFVRGLKLLPQVMLNVRVREKRDLKKEPQILKKIRGIEKKLGRNGRVFIRYSGTEPVLRIMVEGEDKKTIREYAESIADTVSRRFGI